MIKIVKELLDSGAIKQEDADKIQAEWSEHTKKLNAENKTLRTDKEALSKNYDEVLKSKSDLDEQIKGIDERIAKAKKEGHDDMVKQLEDEKTSKSELQTSLSNLQEANTSLILDGAVSKALKEFDLKDSHRETTEFMLRSRVSVNDNGEPIYTDMGEESSIDNGFKQFFEKNDSQLNPKGQPGSGAGNGGSGVNSNKKYFDKTSPDFSLTKQGQIYKESPELYKQLKG